MVDRLDLSFQAKQSLVLEESEGASEGPSSLTSKEEKTRILLEKLLGLKVSFLKWSETAKPAAQDALAPEERPQGPQSSLSIEARHRYEEEESLQFSATGMVTDGEGRTIEFSLSMEQYRSFSTETVIRLGGDDTLQDPLVLYFEGPSSRLPEQTVAIDLDQDGSQETIHALPNRAAFLAYDRNGDGQITHGGELFGPSTGSGFSELSAYDEDQNHWIDEQDSIYGKLSLWFTADPSSALTSLSEAGVGAIYLKSEDTPFTLKNTANETQAAVQRSGVFLTESGQAQVIQELNMTT
jgi:hypothetical protein